MASTLRLYRDIYRIDYNGSTNNAVYTLITPYSLSANSTLYGLGTLIETPTVVLSATGIYYAELDAQLYDTTNIYELNWLVQYTINAPLKTLKTRFRLNVTGTTLVSYITSLETSVESNMPFEYEIISQPIQIEIL